MPTWAQLRNLQYPNDARALWTHLLIGLRGGRYQQIPRCLLLFFLPDRPAEIRGEEWLVQEGLYRDFFDGSVEAARGLLCTHATDGVYVAPGTAVGEGHTYT
jgi:hypothetical protein